MNNPELDWKNLPSGVQTISLWQALHDGALIECLSNRLERTAKLTLHVPHLTPKVDPKIAFSICFNGVTSLRAVLWCDWPGKYEIPDDATREESAKLFEEYKTKGCEQSMDWTAFSSLVNSESLEIYDAGIVISGNRAAFQLGGTVSLEAGDDMFININVAAESAAWTRNDGIPWSLAQFCKLGEDYWAAAARRGTK